MKINVIKTLDKGMSNISASGVVDYCKAAENKTGEFNGKPYSFWTQFIVLKDDTGDIGVNLNLGDSKVNVAKGQEIQIEKGTLDSYVKDGKTFQTLKARLHSVQNPSQQAPQPQQAKNAPTGDDVYGKCRTLIVQAGIQSGQLRCKTPDDVISWTEFVVTGKTETPKACKEGPDDLPPDFDEESKGDDESLPF